MNLPPPHETNRVEEFRMTHNKVLARQWFEKAAAPGNPQAKQNLK
jgi:hypothetical protein